MIDRAPLSSELPDNRERPVRRTITLHDHGVSTFETVATLPARAAVRIPEPRVETRPVVRTRRRVRPQAVALLAGFGGLAAVIVTAFGATGVLMLIGLCVALRLMWTDRAGR
ncbi:hypothetical protein [Umezawaea sp. NPDC059074]|uniref:hypothetical protein n=1 Tax=Umezawaea sp. NPDC059074 TaxID=3346716 RepID=UPI00369FA3CB